MFVVRTASHMVQADVVVLDGKALATHETDEHGRTGHEGGIRCKKAHKMLLAVALGTRSPVRAVVAATAHENACDAPPFVLPLGRLRRAARPGPAYMGRTTGRTRGTRPSRGTPCTARAP